MIQQTSLLAYEEIKHLIQSKEKAVFAVILEHGPISNELISKRLNWPINCVTGRTRGLVLKKLVQEYDKQKNSHGRTVIRWCIK